jgi:beta-phosphoglucomutase
MFMQAVIFDLDGVLTSTVTYHFESWKKALGEYGIDMTSQENDQLLGLTRRRSLEVLLGARVFPERQLQEMLKRKNAYYQEFVEKIGPRDLAPGISFLLQELRLARIRIGVASASENVLPVLQQLGIDGFVQAFTDGVRVRRSKPAPDGFQQTAAALHTNPRECLAIEDSAAGVRAATDAGMVVVGVGPDSRVGMAHATYDNLARVHMKDLVGVYERWQGIEQVPGQIQEVHEFV